MKGELILDVDSDNRKPKSNEESVVFLAMRQTRSLSLLEVETVETSPRYQSKRNSCRKLKLRIVIAVLSIALLLACSIILYFAITHYVGVGKTRQATESEDNAESRCPLRLFQLELNFHGGKVHENNLSSFCKSSSDFLKNVKIQKGHLLPLPLPPANANVTANSIPTTETRSTLGKDTDRENRISSPVTPAAAETVSTAISSADSSTSHIDETTTYPVTTTAISIEANKENAIPESTGFTESLILSTETSTVATTTEETTRSSKGAASTAGWNTITSPWLKSQDTSLFHDIRTSSQTMAAEGSKTTLPVTEYQTLSSATQGTISTLRGETYLPSTADGIRDVTSRQTGDAKPSVEAQTRGQVTAESYTTSQNLLRETTVPYTSTTLLRSMTTTSGDFSRLLSTTENRNSPSTTDMPNDLVTTVARGESVVTTATVTTEVSTSQKDIIKQTESYTTSQNLLRETTVPYTSTTLLRSMTTTGGDFSRLLSTTENRNSPSTTDMPNDLGTTVARGESVVTTATVTTEVSTSQTDIIKQTEPYTTLRNEEDTTVPYTPRTPLRITTLGGDFTSVLSTTQNTRSSSTANMLNTRETAIVGKTLTFTTAAKTTEVSIPQNDTSQDTVPIVFVRGRFNYYQAEDACTSLGTRLALKEDMKMAFQAGYEKCVYGWLLDQHSGFVMQKSGAKPKCGGGIVGVIYSSLRNPLDVLKGAYCLKKHVPVVFVVGKVNYEQAKEACTQLGTRLALKEDLISAYEAGYQRCVYGWLLDGHVGFVMQKIGASAKCGGGKVGLIYSSSSRDPLATAAGAYCLKKNDTLFNSTGKETSSNATTSNILYPTLLGPVAYVSGRFNYYQAEDACTDIGARLALKEDMLRSYQAGFQKCLYGWLLDQHLGYVMQKNGTRPKCGGGKVGLIYSSLKDPMDIQRGAYCLIKKVPIFFSPDKVNYYQAKATCAAMGTQLALKEDMLTAYEAGYQRCTYGWLLDAHQGFVMQKTGARPNCGGGKEGLIYTSYRDPNNTVSGAYCLKLPALPESNNSVPKQITKRSVNWWVGIDPADVYKLKKMLSFDWQNTAQTTSSRKVRSATIQPTNLLGSVHAVYPCCNYFSISRQPGKNFSFVNLTRTVGQMRHLVSEYRRVFANISLRILPHVLASYEAMMQYGAATNNRSYIIDDLASKAVMLGVDGVVVDYEPAEDYTREHAVTYRDFVNDLVDEMKMHNLSVGMMISGWGILKFYDVYSEARCDMFGSMSNTYFGHEILKNINNVREMLKYINRQRLQVGLGSMQMESRTDNARNLRSHNFRTQNFRWNKRNMRTFIEHLRKEDIRSLHIFPAMWENVELTQPYFMNSLLDFVK